MRIISQLMAVPGVIAAGEYSFRGDRYTYEGHLTPETARMASILCRANTLSVNMQVDMFDSLVPENGFLPAQGWIVRGRAISVCVTGNIFCFIQNKQGLLNNVMALLRANLADTEGDVMKYMYSKIGGDVEEKLY